MGLGKSLGLLRQLSQLELLFHACEGLTEVSSLWVGIAEMKEMEHFRLDLTACNQLSPPAIQVLFECQTHFVNILADESLSTSSSSTSSSSSSSSSRDAARKKRKRRVRKQRPTDSMFQTAGSLAMAAARSSIPKKKQACCNIF